MEFLDREEEIASELYKKLIHKVSHLPMAGGKKIIPVLFLKNRPKDDTQGINILYPRNVIDAMHTD